MTRMKGLVAIVLLAIAGLGGGCIAVLSGEGQAGIGFDTKTQAYVFHNVIRRSEDVGTAQSELKGSLADAIVGRIESADAPGAAAPPAGTPTGTPAGD